MSDGLDLEWLLKMRVAIARCGEMDLGKWWNTDGQLGSYGSKMLSRGFPRTHHFAQARSVFTVAAHRCSQVFDPPYSATFWHLSDAIEDEFDARWEEWISDAPAWVPFFDQIAAVDTADVCVILQRLDLVTEEEVAEARSLRRSNEGKSVQLPGPFARDRRSAALLGVAFSLSSIGDLSVPYARRQSE
ncbi:BrxE family protein [Mesorhizobium sp.]|uniref:BrxE family protein n=1 Tax=Mesorhizobium sp. TaxID=1871066 RepID=UPI0025D90D0D|nr:BrxE family protein [Mesorhizobium sp.]